MDTREPPARLPLPYPAVMLERSLLRLYGRLLGEQQKRLDRQPQLLDPDQVERGLSLISELLDYLGTGSDLQVLRPVKTWPKIGPLDFGEMQTEVLAVLRRKGAQWMTVKAIADEIQERHSFELTAEQRQHFLQKLRESLHRSWNDGGFVEPEKAIAKGSGASVEQRWRLSPAKFRSRADRA